MRYANEAWKQERASWRAVIQLNIIRSIITIIDTLEAEMLNDPIFFSDLSIASSEALLRHSIDTTSSDIEATPEQYPSLQTNKYQLLKLRLSPLHSVEADLKRRLGAGTEEAATYGVLSDNTLWSNQRREFGVRAWKDALGNLVKHGSGGEGPQSAQKHREILDEATEVVASCRGDMKALWMDEQVRSVLMKRKMRMEDSAGLSVPLFCYTQIVLLNHALPLPSFLNDLDRIASRVYEPSDGDIVRARLRTLGVQEYRIKFATEANKEITGSTYSCRCRLVAFPSLVLMVMMKISVGQLSSGMSGSYTMWADQGHW